MKNLLDAQLSCFMRDFKQEMEYEKNIIKRLKYNGYSLDKLIQKETLLDAQTSSYMQELDDEKQRITKLKSKIGERYGK